jgi:hypothetical protein
MQKLQHHEVGVKLPHLQILGARVGEHKECGGTFGAPIDLVGQPSTCS